MNHRENNLEALTNLIDKIDEVQIGIETLISLIDFSNTENEEETSIENIINRFSEVYKSNRDKFVLKTISVLESMRK